LVRVCDRETPVGRTIVGSPRAHAHRTASTQPEREFDISSTSAQPRTTESDRHPSPSLLAPAPVVTAHDLTRQYGNGETAVHALRGVSVEVASGQLTAVMGPSGSGKSTLMHILAGLDKPTSGDVYLAGTAIGELNDTKLTKLRREHIGFIFQFFNLLPMLTAKENIVLPLSIAGVKPDPEWLEELTTAVGLTERLSHRPSELSGGQQQRVAIARAVITRPSLLLADEPTGNLDSRNSEAVMELLRDLHRQGATICMVTHDPRYAAHADRSVHLFDGRVVEENVGAGV
jgi:putative ABC transport system ATP-binding protein